MSDEKKAKSLVYVRPSKSEIKVADTKGNREHAENHGWKLKKAK